MSGTRWVTGILGLWIALAGIIGFNPGFTFWDNLIVGIVIAALGFSMVRMAPPRGWITGILGLWVLVAGCIYLFQSGVALFWNNLITGVVIAITAAAVSASGHRMAQAIPHAP